MDPQHPFVITAFRGLVLALRTSDGVEAWRVKVGHFQVRLAVGAEVVLALDVESLTAIEYATGRVIWKAPVGGETLLVTGTTAFVSFMGVLSCVDTRTGAPIWKNELPGTGHGTAAIAVPFLAVQADTTR